jgi:hypothetical protein
MGWASRYLLLGFVPLPNLLASHFCAISLLLLALFAWADLMIGHPAIMVNAAPMKAAGAVLVILGLALHFWAFSTLRIWWTDDKR